MIDWVTLEIRRQKERKKLGMYWIVVSDYSAEYDYDYE